MNKITLVSLKYWRLKNVTIYVLVLSWLFFQGGCTFTPSDEYISPIKPPEPIVVNVEVQAYTTSDKDPFFNNPYYLIRQTLFQFGLKRFSNKLSQVEVRFDNRIIESQIWENKAQFILTPSLADAGTHTIKLTMYVDTQSGSLLQKLGGEFYVIEQQFTVIVDPIPPDFNFLSAEIENGYLTFRWQETQKKNFIYKIRRGGPSFHSIPDLFAEPNVDHVIDKGYVGGYLTYQVIATGFGFEEIIGEGSLNFLPGNINVSKSDDAIVRLDWSQNYIAHEGVQFEIKAIGSNGERNFQGTFSPFGSISIDTLGLTERTVVFVNFVRSGYPDQQTQFNWHIEPTPNIKPFVKYLMLKKSNKLLISSEKTIYRYDLNGIILEDSVLISDLGFTDLSSLIINPDETLAFINGRPGGFISFDPLTFNKVNNFDIEQATNAFANTSYPVAPLLKFGNVSNNGLITIAFWRGANYTMVFDLINNRSVWHSKNLYNPPTLSNDGNYLASDLAIPYADLQGGLFKLNAGQFDLLGKIDYGVYSFLENGNEVMSYTRVEGYNPGERRISIYNYSSPPSSPETYFNQVRGIITPYSEESLVMFDAASQLIIIRYGGYSRLLDPTTMSYIKTIDQSISYFSNGYVLLTSGFIEVVR